MTRRRSSSSSGMGIIVFFIFLFLATRRPLKPGVKAAPEAAKPAIEQPEK